MTTLTVKVPSESEAKLSAFIKELGGEIISVPSKKTKLLKEIKQGLKEVKEIREGKSPSYTISDLFNEK
ncbi:MAG: hypothetical protein JST19_03240 [Bacteroidetes bacterium]|nr:hypothetical protein [Bacteroidota bacterium]